MRKLIAAVMVAGATLFAGQAFAADFPEYPPVIDVPEVDYGVQGSFYLRGSAAANALWAKEGKAYCGCALDTFPFDKNGYGYSLGAGFGYETGTGLRVDATLDFIDNDGLQNTNGPAGDTSVRLRSTLALVNAYYDFSLGGEYGYGAAGGAFGYVGAGAGAAFNKVDITNNGGLYIPSGTNTSFAAAAMAGVGYDFGAVVADVGYRGVYIAEMGNSAPAPETAWSKNNWLHEVRGTVRYRFN